MARRIPLLGLALAGLIGATGPLRAAAPAVVPAITVGMPADFADLAQDHRAVADFFFGGRRVGQFEVDVAPGTMRIVHPDLVVAALAGISDPAALRAALAGPLDPHAQMVCADPNIPCERPTPDIAAVVFDQAHFRVDLYVAPHLLVVRPVTTDRYLAPTDRKLSLVDTIGGALAGGDGQPALYSIRNRAVLGAGAARLISEASVGSGRGADIDTASIQLDRPDLRYVGGLFYTPGADLVGRRRLVGAGIATQFDTRADHTLMSGTPLVVFLAQRSRVDLLVDKRLVSSHVYEAGNQTLDTSSLPEGSYPVEIRIQENSGATHSEQRFFSKSSAIPPAGKTLFFVNAGMLTVDRPGRLFDITGTPLAVAGAARRLGSHLAWDATVMATRQRVLGEFGVTVFTHAFQARVAGLGSDRGDYGALAQISSSSGGRLGYSFDLRRVVSRDNQPLVPLDVDGSDSLLGTAMLGQQSQTTGTTFTQLAGSVTYRLGRAQLGVSAYARRDVGRATSYSAGPVAHWPIVQSQHVQLTFDGSYAQTDHGRAVAFGLHLQLFGNHHALGATLGGQTTSLGDRRRVSPVAEIAGSFEHDSDRLGQVTVAGAFQHSGDGTIEQVSVDDRGPLGYASASLLHRGGEGQSGSQYALSFQTTAAMNDRGIHVGARQQTDSAIVVALAGSARDTRFQVLVDDNPSGFVRPGGRILLSVNPYRRYTVRIRPVGGSLVSFDTRPASVDVFPGTIVTLHWKADPVIAMFGRLVGPDGAPIVNADIVAADAISATDDRGYFQVQAAKDATLLVHAPNGATCRATLAVPHTDKAYTALGDVTCRP